MVLGRQDFSIPNVAGFDLASDLSERRLLLLVGNHIRLAAFLRHFLF